jgi:hypothetical protein
LFFHFEEDFEFRLINEDSIADISAQGKSRCKVQNQKARLPAQVQSVPVSRGNQSDHDKTKENIISVILTYQFTSPSFVLLVCIYKCSMISIVSHCLDCVTYTR